MKLCFTYVDIGLVINLEENVSKSVIVELPDENIPEEFRNNRNYELVRISEVYE